MKRIAILLTAVGLIMSTATSHAEQRWTFDFRAGAGPTRDVAGDPLGPGVGFEGTLAFRFLPHVTAYGGWDMHHFGSDQTFAGTDMDFEETGYAFGMKFEHPFSGEVGNGAAWWLRAGGTFNHIEVENTDGDIVGDSGHGLGWEAGAGVSFPVASQWRLTPGVRYRALSRDVEVSGVTESMDLEYTVIEIGVSRAF